MSRGTFAEPAPAAHAEPRQDQGAAQQGVAQQGGTDAAISVARPAPMLRSPPGLAVGAVGGSEAVLEAARRLAPRVVWLYLASLIAAFGAHLVADRLVSWPLTAAAATLAALGVVLELCAWRARLRRSRLHAWGNAMVAFDAAPALTTDDAGRVAGCNAAAAQALAAAAGRPLAELLSARIAAAQPMVTRLLQSAAAAGWARSEAATGRGLLRLSVRRIGAGVLLWRIEGLEGAEAAEWPVGTGADLAGGCALPILLLSRGQSILSVNEALYRLVGSRPRSLDRLFSDLPLRPGEEHVVQTVSGAVPVRVIVVDRPQGRQEVVLIPRGLLAGNALSDATGFERVPVALLRIDARGRVQAANRAARGMLGPVEPGTALAALLEGLGRSVQDWLSDRLHGRIGMRPEILRVRSSDREIYLQVTLDRIIEDGRPGLVAVLSDATQLKSLEAQFAQSQKMQAIGQLAGGVAHDFNNLLTAISGHCDLLMLRKDRTDPDYADLVQIGQNANRAAALVGQLLSFSRKQRLKPEILDLGDTLGELAHLLNRLVGEKVRLSLAYDTDLRPVRADRRHLEQVIVNLVVNARDAMPAGGTVRIETENLHLGEGLSRDRVEVPAGDYILVRVIDEGQGIPPDLLPKIFEPFYTTKRQGEGTGLGLSTAYGIVKQSGGFIFVDSIVGQGSRFTLYIPALDYGAVADPDPAPPPVAQLRAGHGLGEGTVLLVEDEAPVRAFASRALRLRGFEVHEAESGEQALEMLADPALTVDVFVTDVVMPGLDGPAWVREAMKTRPAVPVVFVSGYAEDGLRSSQAEFPTSVFLPKPFTLTELTATVQARLAR